MMTRNVDIVLYPYSRLDIDMTLMFNNIFISSCLILVVGSTSCTSMANALTSICKYIVVLALRVHY